MRRSGWWTLRQTNGYAMVVIAAMVLVIVFLLWYLQPGIRGRSYAVMWILILLMLFPVMWWYPIPFRRHARKSFEARGREDIEVIAGVLKAEDLSFHRLGPGSGAFETLDIPAEGMTIAFTSIPTWGMQVLVGPVDRYNRTTVERLQGLVDVALAPPRHDEK